MTALQTILTTIVILFIAQNASANMCVKYLASNSPKVIPAPVVTEFKSFNFTAFWNEPAKSFDFNKHKNFNGVLVHEVSRFFSKNLQLPPENILIRSIVGFLDSSGTSSRFTKSMEQTGKLEEYFSHEKSPSSVANILKASVESNPSLVAELVKKIQAFSADHLVQRLRFPTYEAIAQKMEVTEDVLRIIIPDSNKFFKDVASSNPEALQKAQNKLIAAYLRVIRNTDEAEHTKTRPQSPSPEKLLQALVAISKDKALAMDIESKAFTVETLRELIGEAETAGPFSLFKGGVKGVEEKARERNPNAFKSFIPEEIYNERKLAEIMTALEARDGFLVTSVNAGIPVVESQLATMLKYAKDKNYDILVIPTSQILEGLDKRLISNPRIHILTHTISNPHLKLWNIPILTKNQNPLASLDAPGQVNPGQLTIVGHSQLTLKVKPTGSNHIRPTEIWSTGSLSQNSYPFQHAIQGRTSELAKNNHKNGFLVLEKSDSKAGPLGDGAQNIWHVRPVYFKGHRGIEGFTDMNISYFVRDTAKEKLQQEGKVDIKLIVEKVQHGAEVIVLGDLHDRVTDQAYMASITNFIRNNPSIKKIVLHDPIDGNSHNRHEAEQTSLLIRKFTSGDLDFHKEMMGIVQVVNALTSIRPDIQIVLTDSNHSYWAKTLIDKQPQAQSVINGLFLAELTYASRMLGISDPLTYVFQARNDVLKNLPPEKRIEVEAHAIPVLHPGRVIVLPFGESFVYGPKENPTHLNFHGHQGANGAKGSPRSHATGSQNAVTADSHQSFILGDWMSVGTTTSQRVGYNNGGYSAWSNSFVLLYPDGSKQLVIYSSLTQTFMQRKEFGTLKPEDFYGQEPLEVKANDNDVVSGIIVDQFSHFLEATGQIKKPND